MFHRIIRVVLGVVLLSGVAVTAGSFRADSPIYEKVEGWGKGLPPGLEWGEVGGVELLKNGGVIAMRRTDPTLVELDKDGKFVRSWGSGMFVFPHGMMIDRKGNLWISDAGPRPDWKPDPMGRGQQIFKMTMDGKVLLTLGTKGVAGEGPNTFSGAADLVEAANGNIFIADGHVNNRIVKISGEGKFIKAWGTKGSKPGELNLPHTIAMDSKGRLFVGDRGNARIQIFDQEGTFLAEWKQFGPPSGIAIGADDTMVVTDLSKGAVNIGSAKDGVVAATIPANGEMVAVAPNGDIYLAEIAGKTLTKYVRRSPQSR